MLKLYSPHRSKMSQSPPWYWRLAAMWRWCNPARDKARQWRFSILRRAPDRNRPSDSNRRYALGSRPRTWSFRSTISKRSAAQVFAPRTSRERVMLSAKCWPASYLRRHSRNDLNLSSVSYLCTQSTLENTEKSRVWFSAIHSMR